MRFHRSWAFMLLALGFSFYSNPARSVQIQRVVSIPGHVPAAALADATDLGPVPSDEILSLALVLPLRNADALDDLLRSLYDPADPLHGRFLSGDEFVSQFGPTQEDYDAVNAFARSYGLTIAGTHPNRLLLDASGTAASVESAFGVELRKYQAVDGRIFRAPLADPVLPVAIARRISAVIGLETSEVFQSHLQARSADASPRTGIGSGPGSMLSPTNIRKAYGLSGVSADGTGQTLALFELDGYRSSDVAAYVNYFGLPSVSLKNVLIDNYSGSAGSGATEVTMDIELQIALAPGVSKIYVYEGPNGSTGTLDTYNRIATDNASSSISTSWGLSEDSNVSSFLNSENAIFKQMAAQGQSIFAASGDYGAYDNGSSLGVDDPASQPYMCGVGGTKLSVNSDGSYKSETVWNNGSTTAGAGGGGISKIWTIPTWQRNAMAVSSGGGSTTYRNVPDVSLHADPNTGYSFYYNGGWYAGGGTSAAAPLWAAFAVLVNQQRLANGQSVVGFINPSLYSIFDGANYASDFHDISDGKTNLYYKSVAGFDDATGLGSFNGSSLFAELTASTTPATPTNLTATAGNAQVSLVWTAATGATGYNVKRSASTGGPYVTVASASKTSLVDTGLTNGATFYYVVSATNSVGESANSSEVSATPQLAIPSSPTNLTATKGSSQVSLSWTAATGATSYNVKRSAVSGGAYSTVASVATTTYADTGLTNGTTYYYVVSAVNATGESANSAQVSATPQAIPAPAAPTKLTATAGNALVSLSWIASSAATSYNVKRSASSGGPYSTVASAASTAYSDSGLVNGTAYYYVVSAINSGGESANSAQVTATPKTPVPSAPTNLKATAGNAQVSLSWTASTYATTYNVKRSSSKTGAYSKIASVSSPSYADSGVSNGATYYYVVSAVNASGESANSTQASATPQPPPPSAPANLTATGGSFQVSLSWTASSGATSYKIKAATVSGGSYVALGSTASTSYVCSGLKNGTAYYFVVTASNGGGESANSSEASATPILTPPATPSGLSATAGNAQVSLKWTAVSYATAYGVKYALTSGGPYSTIQSIASNSCVITGATNGTTYYFVISASNAAGESSDSKETTATPKLPLPTAPAGLKATAGVTQVALAWTASSYAASYNVKRSATKTGAYATVASVATPGYADTGLTAGSTYYYVVSAVNVSGESANSAQANAIPLPTPPSAPANLTATGGSFQVSLSWTASSGATSYKIKAATVSGGSYVALGSTASTSYVCSGLKNGTAYYFVVTASNGGGESANSSEASATPILTPPATPSGLSATAGNAQVSLKWTAVSYATAYGVKYALTSGGPYSTIQSVASTSCVITGATNGTTYYFVVSASNAAGESANTSEVSATPKLPAPAVPAQLTATAGNSQITLSWAASSLATSYNVKRGATKTGPFSALASVSSPGYSDSGLTNGTTYYYVISAVNSSGESANSSSASATPQPPAPSAPTNLTTTPGNGQITLSWTASSSATSYYVKRALSKTSAYTKIATVTSTSYVSVGLKNGSTYYFMVSAVNGGGESANSSSVSASPSAH